MLKNGENGVNISTVGLIELLDKVNDEFENLETFLEVDESKSERFKIYLKLIYDYLKTHDDSDLPSESSKPKSKKSNGHQASSKPISFDSELPELIVDKDLVDLEQIYQQLQLFSANNSSSTNEIMSSFTKFFSKCLVQLDTVSFGVDLKSSSTAMSYNKNSSSLKNGAKNYPSSSIASNDDSVDGDEDEDEDEEEFEEETEEDEEDELDGLIASSKKIAKNGNSSNFGIPDGSDSEISDFEVNEDEEEEEQEEQEGEEDDEDDLEDKIKNKEKSSKKVNFEEIDSDEVDEDLVDLYDQDDLGDEKELLEIGKPSKSFAQVDFDRDDFGVLDDENLPDSNKSNDLFDQDDERGEEDRDENGKSSFELRQEKLQEKVKEIHDSMLKNLENKPWQTKGEVTARTRPQDSLLQEYLEFDAVSRLAPITNADTTEQLEKLIKQRIKDKAFDDVERKVKPVDMQYEYKKQVILDQEKSKLGLGDVYEQEFLKQQEKANGVEAANGSAVDKSVVSNPKHEEIRKRLQSLFIKLDALSNFHFTPKAPVPELKVVSNMPSINMEEVAPVHMNDANLLAPEEIKAKINGLPKSKSEEDKADKRRNLRNKKLIGKQKKIKREKKLPLAQALNPDNSKLNKEIAMDKLKKQAKNMSKNIKILKQDKTQKANKVYKSSTAFFKQLQENTQIGKKVVKKKRTDAAGEKMSGKRLKL